jgi:hypothetical protein
MKNISKSLMNDIFVSFLIIFFALGFLVLISTKDLHAQGCEANYPVLNDKTFQDLVAIMGYTTQSDSADKIAQYIKTNNLDEEQVMLAISKLTVNIDDRMNPNSNVIDEKFADCVGKIRFNQSENALLEKYFHNIIDISNQRRSPK